MRGERPVTRYDPASARGSSPHARGTLRAAPANAGVLRIIPACAGNAKAHHESRPSRPDHPRMRGERPMERTVWRIDSGSSPHARGTHPADVPEALSNRIIPACAGNAGILTRQNGRCTDHPRMRGERVEEAAKAKSLGGSSPHARGTPPAGERAKHRARIIPACAGNAAWRG